MMRCSPLCLPLLAVALAMVNSSPGITSNNTDFIKRTFQMLHKGLSIQRQQSPASVNTKWITQKLDHFDASEERTWQMRYMENAEFATKGSPIFIIAGGEWPIQDFVITGGHYYDMAKEQNGYLFYTEHRYYGDSRPTSNLSNDNMKYLHVSQALADLAHFIRTIKSTYDGLANSKVVLIGCSYSAALVTWFKREYPSLAAGVWASSAPLLAKVNFYEYKEIAGQSIRLLGGDDCYNSINNAFLEMETMFAEKRGAEVKAMLKLCNSFDETNDLDLWSLFGQISNVFTTIVQTHRDGMIQDVCQQILNEDNDVVGVIKYVLGFTERSGCNDLSYKALLKATGDTVHSNNVMRQWIYQTCTAFGWYQSTDSKDQPFGSSLPRDIFLQVCKDSFGPQFTNEYVYQQIEATNAHYGGLRPEVENVYFTHGQLDPWRPMGIQDLEQATIIPNHSHCNDIDSISDSDSIEMRASKERIAELVRQWLAE